MSLLNPIFAIAGLIAAAGPVVIHLLNRRRYRTVEWGAMALLRRSNRTSRRAVKLRDFFLLALRMAALILFGLTLARLSFSPSVAGADLLRAAGLAAGLAMLVAGTTGLVLARAGQRLVWAAVLLLAVLFLGGSVAWRTNGPAIANSPRSNRQPVHAIFVLDNSRSMRASSLKGTLLDTVKEAAIRVVNQLPAGSRIAVMPLCGPEQSFSFDPFVQPTDAEAAIRRIVATDRQGTSGQMYGLVRQAATRLPNYSGKQALFFTDGQSSGWDLANLPKPDADLPPVRAVVPSQPKPANVWVEDFSVQDGVAELGATNGFNAVLRAEGETSVDLLVTLQIAGQPVASTPVTLQPGQRREVLLRATPEESAGSSRIEFLPTEVLVTVVDPASDRLAADNQFPLAVPVAAALPVVFVDEFGGSENVELGRVGETRSLRRLLTATGRDATDRASLIKVRHLSEAELSRAQLEDARLVVVAGIERPSDEMVQLLHEYVVQGGPLLIAAGGAFDPAAWTTAAWDANPRLLPAPLDDLPIGVRPSRAVNADEVRAFGLDTASLTDPLFRVSGESDESLADLYRQPFFFQAVAARPDAIATDQFNNRPVNADADSPRWLQWSHPGNDPGATRSAASTAAHVLGLYAVTNQNGEPLPFLIERRIGAGRVMLLTSGLSSDWNTLARTTAVVILDRLCRSLIEGTLPNRNFEAGETIALPLDRNEIREYRIAKPNGEISEVSIDATGSKPLLRLSETSDAGHYTVTSGDGLEGSIPPLNFAVHGAVAESNLTPLSEDQRAALIAAGVQWISTVDQLELVGGAVLHDWVWRWLLAGLFLCLAAELLVGNRFGRSSSEATPNSTLDVQRHTKDNSVQKSRVTSRAKPRELVS